MALAEASFGVRHSLRSTSCVSLSARRARREASGVFFSWARSAESVWEEERAALEGRKKGSWERIVLCSRTRASCSSSGREESWWSRGRM
eukprot:scaffold266597_cov24-Tisochrysis_lutea.AAC.1